MQDMSAHDLRGDRMKNLKKRILALLKEHQPRKFLDICTALRITKQETKMEVYRTLKLMKTEKTIMEVTPYGTKEIGLVLPGWIPNGE